MTLDAAPLLEAIRRRGGLRHTLGLDDTWHGPGVRLDRTLHDPDLHRWARAYHRMRKSGRVSVWQADRFCVHVLGTLPELVWGDAFFDGCDDEVAA